MKKIRYISHVLILSLLVISCSNGVEIENEHVKDVVEVLSGDRYSDFETYPKAEKLVTSESEFLAELENLFPVGLLDYPEINFEERDVVILVHSVFSHGGLKIGNFQMYKSDSEMFIEYSLMLSNSTACNVTSVMTQPYLVVSIPKLADNFPDVDESNLKFVEVDYESEADC